MRPPDDLVDAVRKSFPGSARWGQLTYSSFDDNAVTGGGWQVKQTSGALAAPEREHLLGLVDTRLDLVAAPSSFPTPEEIADIPRRLVYLPTIGMPAGYWHTASAGPDASGRPGNVFVHAALDRDAGEDHLRPIQRWGSASWLCPYGPQQVLASILDDEVRPGRVIDLAAVVEFVFDTTTWRLGTLTVLIDAVAAALAGGTRVVLGCDSPTSAALWIGAVSFLMSPGTARKLAFSTYERLASIGSAWTRGVCVAAVPRKDLAECSPDPDVVVIDEHEMVETGAFGVAPHRTQAGSTVAVTEWSLLAGVVLFDPEVATRAIQRLDDVAARVHDVDLRPGWPLAMVAAMEPASFGDAAEAAAAVVAASSPEGLHSDGELLAVAAALIRPRLGVSASDAWEHLYRLRDGAQDRSVVFELALHVYVERAVQDREWLGRSDGAPVHGLRFPDPDLGAAVVAAADACLGRMSQVHSNEERLGVGREALCLLDFATRAGVEKGTLPESEAALRRLTDGCIRSVLELDDGRHRLAATSPVLAEATLLAYIRPEVRRAYSREFVGSFVPLGRRLSSTVLAWLFPGGSNDPPQLDEHDPLVCEWAVSLARQPDLPESVRGFALDMLLDAYQRQPDFRYELPATALASGLDAATLSDVAGRHPGLLGASAAQWALEREPWGPHLKLIVGDLVQSAQPVFRSDPTVTPIAYLRWYASWVSRPDFVQMIRKDALAFSEQLYSLHAVPWSAQVKRELAPMAVIATVIRLLGYGQVQSSRLASDATARQLPLEESYWALVLDLAGVATPEPLGPLLASCIHERLLSSPDLLWVYVMGAPGFPLRQHPMLASWRRLYSVTIGDSAESIIDVLAAAETDRLTGWDDDKLQTSLNERIAPLCVDLPEKAYADLFDECWKFARQRLKLLRSRDRRRTSLAAHMIKRARH